MSIIVTCEESQAVTCAFRDLGYEAFSCDILPTSGPKKEWHIQGDAITAVSSRSWDFVISFPPCTDLAVSGARWFDKKRLSGAQEQSILFFMNIWMISDSTENPVGIMNGGTYIKKWFPNIYKMLVDAKFPFAPSQIIQPWQFGHGETKATCLWNRMVPNIIPTNIVSGREQKIWRMPPSEDRGKLRSKTYQGVAHAMAYQWGKYLDSRNIQNG